MAELPDLYPGFDAHFIDVPGAKIFARTGGSGPPLLLLHGYPQTHVCWHKVAPELARHFTLVIPDLRGYGASTGPANDGEGDVPHFAYSKRAMAADFVALMRVLGHDRFAVASHDRGARVGYRLALDHPDSVSRLAVLDIVSTLDAWSDTSRSTLIGRFHWSFLARPAPFPETVIGRDPSYFLEYLLAQWTASQDLKAFDPAALAHYRDAFAKPEVIHASCEDYRAGATCDVTFDAADRTAGRQIVCPMLALWGVERGQGAINAPLKAWQAWCPDIQAAGVVSGHFLPEEQPAATLSHLVPFFLASEGAR
jgi:haloacetate dehalogenase